MSDVLVDTSALIAILDRDDPRHERVLATFTGLRDARLLVHGYVVAESVAVVRRRFGTAGVTALLDGLLPATELVAVSADVHLRALEAFRRAQPSGTSFVDRVSVEVMADLAIPRLLALDGDFAGHDFTVLPVP